MSTVINLHHTWYKQRVGDQGIISIINHPLEADGYILPGRLVCQLFFPTHSQSWKTRIKHVIQSLLPYPWNSITQYWCFAKPSICQFTASLLHSENCPYNRLHAAKPRLQMSLRFLIEPHMCESAGLEIALLSQRFLQPCKFRTIIFSEEE